MRTAKVSVCIASHNMKHLISQTLDSVLSQDYKNIEIIVLIDASVDGTFKYLGKTYPKVKRFISSKPSGTGGAFNKAIAHATGSIILLLCADDVLTDHRVISDIVELFKNKEVGHVSRYYHQFVDGDRTPVRAWRCNDIIELANNPSGLAFRRSAIKGLSLSNKMFVEASTLVHDVLKKWDYRIMRWDTVAVRIHKSISRNPAYYRKRWVSSPVEAWTQVGGHAIQSDFTSLIQIKNYFTTRAVIKEVWNFIRLRPFNLLLPAFWFFSIIAIFTPRFILFGVPDLYRQLIGRHITGNWKRLA